MLTGPSKPSADVKWKFLLWLLHRRCYCFDPLKTVPRFVQTQFQSLNFHVWHQINRNQHQQHTIAMSNKKIPSSIFNCRRRFVLQKCSRSLIREGDQNLYATWIARSHTLFFFCIAIGIQLTKFVLLVVFFPRQTIWRVFIYPIFARLSRWIHSQITEIVTEKRKQMKKLLPSKFDTRFFHSLASSYFYCVLLVRYRMK